MAIDATVTQAGRAGRAAIARRAAATEATDPPAAAAATEAIARLAVATGATAPQVTGHTAPTARRVAVIAEIVPRVTVRTAPTARQPTAVIAQTAIGLLVRTGRAPGRSAAGRSLGSATPRERSRARTPARSLAPRLRGRTSGIRHLADVPQASLETLRDAVDRCASRRTPWAVSRSKVVKPSASFLLQASGR